MRMGTPQSWFKPREEGVPPMFSLRDPDGNRLYVVERMAA
jgi:hypothetical protein